MEQAPGRPAGRISLAFYAALAGLASSFALYFWHIWSDNAYLYLYFLAAAFYLVSFIAGFLELSSRRGWIRALLIIVVAGSASLTLVRVAGADQTLANQLLAGGNGSQSPCLAGLFHGPVSIPPGGTTISAAELRASEVTSLSGGLDQALVPFLAILIFLLISLWPADRVRLLRALRGLEFAGVFGLYLYLRGPAAWCGQALGLDAVILALILGALLLKTSPKYLL